MEWEIEKSVAKIKEEDGDDSYLLELLVEDFEEEERVATELPGTERKREREWAEMRETREIW